MNQILLSLTNRNSRPEVFCEKGVLRNFAKFTGKHLCHGLFFNKVADPKTLFLQNTSRGCFWTNNDLFNTKFSSKISVCENMYAYLNLHFTWDDIYRSCHRRCFVKKGVLRNFAKFTGKHMWQSLFFSKVAGRNFIKKETLAQVFSCEFCKISKSTFSTEHLQTTASSYTSVK